VGGCVVSREIDFLLKTFAYKSQLSHVCGDELLEYNLSGSLNHRKVTKAEPSRMFPGKPAANLKSLIIVVVMINFYLDS